MYSQRIREWAQSSVYRGLKLVLQLKGNPCASKLSNAVFGISLREIIELEWKKQMWQLLQNYYITDLKEAQEVFNRFNIDITWNYQQSGKDFLQYANCYTRLKMCCRYDARNWVKWTTYSRFNSFSHKKKAAAMQCPTHKCKLDQRHIMECSTFNKAFITHGNSAEYTKKLLTEPKKYEDMYRLKWYLKEMVSLEKQVSSTVKEILKAQTDPSQQSWNQRFEHQAKPNPPVQTGNRFREAIGEGGFGNSTRLQNRTPVQTGNQGFEACE